MAEQDSTRPESVKQVQSISNYIDSTTAQLLLDMSATIDFLEHDLQGERLVSYVNEKTNERVSMWTKTGMRMMNPKGVKGVVSILHSYLNPNSSLSILTDYEIENLMIRFHIDLAGLIVDNQDEFDIKNEYLYILTTKITDVVWFAVKRAKNGKTLESFTRSHSSQEREVIPRERKKILGLF